MPPEDPTAAAVGRESAADNFPEHISQNIDSIIAFHRREQVKLSDAQRSVERLAAWLGRPRYLASAAIVAMVWLLYNTLAPRLHLPQFDRPPFPWLQGLFSLGAFFTTTVVLISQNRQARFETQRLNLDLQVNLMTEQKTTKLIHLIEELRHDLPMVHDRHDPVAAAMQTPTDTARVLEALEGQATGTAARSKE
ncbi:MAG TPA: DUF1003 domain-containing protein [Steroidobacteraceae bacterium]|nr:DUF1003 domain-containing protein [Steroidobacteraceae bacterium]